MPTVADRDIEILIAEILREGERDARLVAAFLESIGLSLDAGNGVGFPEDWLLKLAALLKIARWERAGITAQLGVDLPTSEEVYLDLITLVPGQPARFSGPELSRRVLLIHLGRIAWSPWEHRPAAVAIEQSLAPDEFLDRLAQFLWDHRHLAMKG